MPINRAATAVALVLTIVTTSFAADPGPIPRRLPPAGVKLDPGDRQKIETELRKVQDRIAKLAGRAELADVLPDVQVYEKAVRYALLHDEFYPPKKPAAPAKPKPGESAKPQATAKPAGVGIALDLLKSASARLDELEQGKHSWTGKTGLIVRGYTSDIDGSLQPYGLDIGKNVDLSKPVPLYVWLHGRGDTTTDLYFITQRQDKRGEVQHDDAIVLHPFGRHCVGYKNAGEIDVVDAIESVKQRYKIDENRIVLCGFSMGGAGAWHIGAHYADRFCVVQPGAGFVEVQRYQKLDPKTTPVAEKTLWGQYDVPDYVRNFRNTNVISYSGENDKQRASANIMAEEFKKDGQALTQFIGPKVEHKYLPLPDMLALIDKYVKLGRNPTAEVHLQTKTLRYNKMFWVEITGLEEHWKDARVDARRTSEGTFEVTTKNVNRLTLRDVLLPASGDPAASASVVADGKSVPITPSDLDDGALQLVKLGGGWTLLALEAPKGPYRKFPALQGPIDDAFMSPFLFVAPTGKAASPAVAAWTAFEMKHQQDRWRALMRGDLRIKNDTEVTADDIARYNLVLWGDATSNKLLGELGGKLPVTYAGDKFTFAGKTYDAKATVPALIYPNPQNPSKYVVLNSGLTFREAHDGTNSQQNPKLGDWAIISLEIAPNAAAPAKILANGFFDEAWQVK